MSLTDAPKQVNITDIYPEGTPFVVTQAWVEGVVKTQYGDRTVAKVMVEPIGGQVGQAVEYAVWGSLCEQVRAVDPAELPLTVTIVKDGKRHLFKDVDPATLQAYQQAAQAPAPPSADEAALGVAPQAQDVGAVPPAAPSIPPTAPGAAINGDTAQA
ncbi:MAG TPA: hypothetical protein VHU24_03250 [Solirubrobacterales bacterium]|jgi:hypothetical protein|nr:hypothetical protein [Solirubrobacterales bacterium]